MWNDNIVEYTADDEEPDCGRCDNVCASQEICDECGSEYYWQYYKFQKKFEKKRL